MKIFSYKMEHDYGLAPNPFGKYCTIAVCKSGIRKNKNIEVGDWVIGTGSIALDNLHHLIYAMQVEEKLPIQDYWDDSRFEYKKPKLNGSLVQLYGDNIYHCKDNSEEWIQENGAHSFEGGAINEEHLKRDVGGRYVLISKVFYYFGNASIPIPKAYHEVCAKYRPMIWRKIPEVVRSEFVCWLTEHFTVGIHGDPINWKEHFVEEGENESQ